MVSGFVSQPPERIKLIISGRVVDPDLSLMTQGVKNSATVMVILLQDAGSQIKNILTEILVLYNQGLKLLVHFGGL